MYICVFERYFYHPCVCVCSCVYVCVCASLNRLFQKVLARFFIKPGRMMYNDRGQVAFEEKINIIGPVKRIPIRNVKIVIPYKGLGQIPKNVTKWYVLSID